MNEVQVFNSPVFGKLPIIEMDGKEYFGATEAAKALSFANPWDAIKNYVDEDDLADHEVIDSLGRKQSKKFVTESGLYALIFGAARQGNNPTIKAKAKQFQKWVFGEVLPSIRKTGGYQSQPALRLPQNNVEMLQVIQVTDAKANKRIDALSNEFSDLKESFGLPNDMRKRFTKARNKRVVEVMGGYHGTAYANKKVRSAVYRQLSNFLKERYVIDEYASLPMSKFEEAMRLTANWEPDEILSLAIDGANEQSLLNA